MLKVLLLRVSFCHVISFGQRIFKSYDTVYQPIFHRANTVERFASEYGRIIRERSKRFTIGSYSFDELHS